MKLGNTDPGERPSLFLSSPSTDWFEGHLVELPLRTRILDARHRLPVQIWAYELLWPAETWKDREDADRIIDRCFQGIKKCDFFVFLISGRHGTSVPYTPDPVMASYLELELFAAAMLGKPILALQLRGHDPEPALKDVTDYLRSGRSTIELVVDDEEGLFRILSEMARRFSDGTMSPGGRSTASTLPDWLSLRRSRRDMTDDVVNPRLMFLNDSFRWSRKHADPAKAHDLIDQVQMGIRTIDTREEPMPHGAALFRLWSAFRELLDESGSTASDPRTAMLWDRAFGLWASHASWFGLHGHLWLAPLAALNSQTWLRKRFAETAEFSCSAAVREPLGAKASALYSIAHRMHSHGRRVFHYRQAVSLATDSIRRSPETQIGALSIRGHALLRLARHGYAWNVWSAAEDFEQALSLVERNNPLPSAVGAAMVDLGFGQMFCGRLRTGLRNMTKGVELMRENTSPAGYSFLARALRKLEQAYRMTGSPGRANKVRDERLRIAEVAEATDQLKPP